MEKYLINRKKTESNKIKKQAFIRICSLQSRELMHFVGGEIKCTYNGLRSIHLRNPRCCW